MEVQSSALLDDIEFENASIVGSKRRVRFSEVSSVRFVKSKVIEDNAANELPASEHSNHSEMLISSTRDEKVQEDLESSHVDSASNIDDDFDVDCVKPDEIIATKLTDGPNIAALATQALVFKLIKDRKISKTSVLHFFQRFAEVSQNVSANQESLRASLLLCELVIQRLDALIVRLDTRGRAAMLPSTQVLTPQIAPGLRFLRTAVSSSHCEITKQMSSNCPGCASVCVPVRPCSASACEAAFVMGSGTRSITVN
mmetsp:Transcript_46873/g.124754  ORF Transcript_46873/g.124754 Transcript_46873/m.124754 type:complete len:256 (+) Transcript_46873:92-859(+)